MQIETLPCPKCKKAGVVNVISSEGAAFLAGGPGLMQDIMPTTPAPIREQLMTGTHPTCWDEMMSEEEE